MLNPLDAVRTLCPGVDPGLIEMHFRRMPSSYFERYSAAEVARHVRQVAGMAADPTQLVSVEVRPLAAQAFEVAVVGADFTGVLACITTALAAEGLGLQEVQLATYLEPDPGAVEPTYFVDVLRVSGTLGGRSLKAVVEHLRDRLMGAFRQLAVGDFSGAQVAASGGTGPGAGRFHTPTSGGRTQVPAGVGTGQVLGGDFRLVDKVAAGGMGQVYRAHQLSLNRTVAVKVSTVDPDEDASMAGRFTRETGVLARFTCPYIVQVLAAGTADAAGGKAVQWLAMEYMEGGDLSARLKRDGPPPVATGVRWFRQALEGLGYAHRQAVIHRDVKPHNMLLTADGDLKVGDFGLVRHTQHPAETGTIRGSVLGTPYYMAPEQALGDSVDDRSDLYAIGATFFQVFAGRLPFDEKSSAAVLAALANRDAPRLRDVAPAAPRPLDVILGRLMARRPEDRYQDARVVLDDLASYERRGLLGGQEPTAIPGPPTEEATIHHRRTRPSKQPD
ncbi:MAG: hypothetical protein JWO38_1069 [Gemmataceae bacterium]|nr:hypothetical protein [Gemmataceae bacterium]